MNTQTFSTYKFRASSIKNLMVTSRSKDPLSETTKTYLQEVYIEQVYGRKKPIITPAMQKGTIVESDALDLVQQVTQKTYFKNTQKLENEYMSGTPDVIHEEYVIDMKSSWDIWTFAKVTKESALKDYYYQLLTYMYLTNRKKAQLIFTLVDTPETIITDELYRMSFKLPEAEVEALRKNYIYQDIPQEQRIKIYDIEYNEGDIQAVIDKITVARQYLNGMHL